MLKHGKQVSEQTSTQEKRRLLKEGIEYSINMHRELIYSFSKFFLLVSGRVERGKLHPFLGKIKNAKLSSNFPFQDCSSMSSTFIHCSALKVWDHEWFWNPLGQVEQCWSEPSNKCKVVSCEPPPDITQHESDSDLQKCLHSPKQWECKLCCVENENYLVTVFDWKTYFLIIVLWFSHYILQSTHLYNISTPHCSVIHKRICARSCSNS